MELSSTYEYVVSLKNRPKYKLRRALLLGSYILYAAALLVVGVATGWLAPLLALVPLSTWIIVWLTWRYGTVEYEYSLTGGVMTLSKIYGGRTRRRLGEISIKSMSAIMPFEGEYIKQAERYAPERTIDLTADLQRPNVYCALYETSEKRRGILYFEATDRALRILKYYNSATVHKVLPE